MEPGFYQCKDCGHCWERMEYKIRQNPPCICPLCHSSNQGTNEVKEKAYVKDVYGPIVHALFNAIPPKKDLP